MSTRPLIGIRVCAALLIAILLSGCAGNKTLTVGATATLLEDVATATSKQSDLRIVEKGMPAYLMLMDGMVEGVPANERLLLAASQTYASYASAFVQDSDPEYAQALFKRARNYALAALAERGINNPATTPFETFEAQVAALGPKDVPYLFWSAANWGSWISLNLDSMEAMAELPRVEVMMRHVLKLDEGYHYGGPHLFMGIWYASRPPIAGGDLEQAQQHFTRAMELSDHQFLMTKVYYADYYARKTFDKQLFTTALKDVLATPANTVPELTLLNTVAHRKALKMLAEADEYFD
jgi:hypothetical protein